jgi:transcriptional regulator with PAS, ATPase and Fis domain
VATAENDVLANLTILCAEAIGAQLALAATNQDLRRLLSEQKAIIDHISDGLLMVDRAGSVRHTNVPAGRILSLNPEQSVGKRFSDLLDFEPIIAPIFETGVGYVDRELIIDSERRHLHLMDTAVPIKNDRGDVESIVNTFREIQRVRQLAQQIAGNHARCVFEDIIGTSEPLLRAIGRARKAAASSATVLLNGESGTGKEVFAQAIHAASGRKGAPFVAINCAALPRELIESELFGYVSGSFTGGPEGRPPGQVRARIRRHDLP